MESIDYERVLKPDVTNNHKIKIAIYSCGRLIQHITSIAQTLKNVINQLHLKLSVDDILYKSSEC